MESGETRYVYNEIFKCNIFKEKINIFNRGNHYRDFTYIDDVTSMVKTNQ